MAETPSFTVQSGRMDSLDVGALLDRPGLTTRLTGTLTASAEGSAPDSMRARMRLELLPSQVNQEEIRSGLADLTLDRGALNGDLRMVAADGELDTRVRGSTQAGRHRFNANGTLRLERLDRWSGHDERTGRLAGRFSLEGSADSAGLASLAGTITASGAVDSVRIDSLSVALSPSPGKLLVDTVVVRSNVAVMDGGGRLALRDLAGADTLRLAAVLMDPTPLTMLAGLDSLSLDSARARLTVSGPPRLRRVEAEGVVRRLLYAGNQVDRLTLNGGASLDSAGLAGAAGELHLEGGALGTIVVRDARLAGRYDSVVTLQANAVLRDSIAFAAAFQGTAAADTIEGSLRRLDLAEGGRNWALARPVALSLRPRRVEVKGFDLRAGDHRITLNGLLDRSGSSDVALEIRQFDLDLPRRLGYSPVAGTLDGVLRLTGPAESPTLSGKTVAVLQPVEGEEPGRVGATADWSDAGLRLDATASHGRGGRFVVSGTLPLRLTLAPKDTASAVGVTRQPDDTLGLVIQADSFDLAFAEPFLPAGTAEELAGHVMADGRISGTMKAPVAAGTVQVTGFGATLPTLGLRYEKGDLAGRLSGDRFQLERLHLVTDNDGELTVQGNVDLSPLDDPSLDLTADLREFRVSHSATLRAIASGKLRLQGTAAKPVMTGDLELGRTDVFTGTETAAASGVEEVELSPRDLQQLAREFGPAALARANEGPGLVDRFKLDLDVRLPGRVWFRRRETPKMDIEIAGRMKVKQEPGQPMQFFGRVEPLPGRGSIELYGRNFRLVEGEIALAGPAESTNLDVKVEYQVPTQADPGDEGVLINVAATGRPDSLKLEFTSEPTMSQDDIVSYIVTGRPASENPLAGGGGNGESAGAMGADIALTRLSESVSGAAGEALGLDVFQIRQDGLRGVTLTAGRYVASRVFLSLQQPIQLTSQAQNAGSTFGPGFELEYTAHRWLRANLRGGNVPPRFFLRGRYAF
jgi:translocation and assembly module TamB